MLKSQAIVETLVEGCVQGTFVIKLIRPDRSFRTWWRTRPDNAALVDPALELVLPEVAELGDISSELLAPSVLPNLWSTDEITVQAVLDYFNGTSIVQVEKGGFTEPVPVPKASPEVVETAIGSSVSNGRVWLLSGPASLLFEPIPAGVLTPAAKLRVPPAAISATAILPENLPSAWKDGSTNALAVITALSQQAGYTLPWKVARDVIGGSLNARFIMVAEESAPWPCDLPSAAMVKLKVATNTASGTTSGSLEGIGKSSGFSGTPASNILIAQSSFEPVELQDLADALPQLLEIKNKSNIPLTFKVMVQFGDGNTIPSPEATSAINKVLLEVKEGLQLQQ